MKEPFLYNSSPFSKLIFSLFIVLICFFLALFLGVIIALPFWGVDLFEVSPVPGDSGSQGDINRLKYLQTVFSLGIFIVPPFVISWFITKSKTRFLFFKPVENFGLLIIAGIMMIAALPFINFLAEMNAALTMPDFLAGLELKMKNAERSAQIITESFLNVNSINGLAINIFVMALIPAIGEELLFRGVLQRLIIEWTKNIHWGIVISAVLFSAFHFQFYGFLPRMVLGVFLGYLLVYGKSIWFPIFAHFVNNAFAVIMSFIYRESDSFEEIENFGSYEGTYFYVLIGVGLLGLMIAYFISNADREALTKYKKEIFMKPGNSYL